ncbi:MAG: methyltransferase domain-containing protein [Synergistaceae bacterium]|jgi:SAM-dependent methyltransferase|nr:methyltransferase domain-containing protein [Synergistaceae bacterium]
MSNQEWNPEKYAASAGFVSELGRPVLDLLKPQFGERILDLGCGDGELMKILADKGYDVAGVDSSPEMVEAARSRGLDVRVMNAENLEFGPGKEFDAVVSNAALHWMSDQYAVVRSVWRALAPNGRFAAECGGEGCVRIIREGMKLSLAKRGIDYKPRNPWKFLEVGIFSRILENQGFRVSFIARFDRPTPLPDGLRGWLGVFSNRHTEGFSDEEREGFYDDVEEYCRPRLYNERLGWVADYVRLRFLAEKPA